MVRGSWIKPGAVIIDVGINPVEVKLKLPSPKKKKRLKLLFSANTFFLVELVNSIFFSLDFHLVENECNLPSF